MRRCLVPTAALLLVLALAGCGAKSKNASPNTQSTKIVPANSECDAKGITTPPNREGICEVRGFTITVADKAHWLHAQDYDVRFVSLRTASALRSRSGGSLRPHGRFVVVTLSVKNTGTIPQRFNADSNLVFLLVDKRTYSESPEGERDPALNSFASQSSMLQPDEVRPGTVVFDLPGAHSKHAFAAGSDLVFLKFSDAGTGFPASGPPSRKVAYLRLWK